MRYDIIIIGGGPAGYPAAALALRQGLKTLLVEGGELGGTCLNCGCIPTKTFCRSAETALDISRAAEFGVEIPRADIRIDMRRVVERKNEVVAQLREGVASLLSGCDVKLGMARFTAPGEIEVAGERFTAPRIIVATGSVPAPLDIPGKELCADSTSMLDNASLPSSMVIIGGGVIGLEFASVYNAFGCEVTVIEYCKEILPGFDRYIAKRLRSVLSRRGIKFILNAAATAVAADAESSLKCVSYTAKGKPGEARGEVVMMATGRRARIPEGFAEAGGEVTRKGIAVDDSYLTSIPGVYAIGDCNGICQLAHAATAQAVSVMGGKCDRQPVPAAVFTVPEVASTGLTEEQAEQQGIAIRSVKLPVRSNGKALAMGETEGMVKVILAADSDRILGCHILGPHASDLIMEASLAISADLPAEAISSAIHPHPTLSELLHSAISSL